LETSIYKANENALQCNKDHKPQEKFVLWHSHCSD